MWRFHAYPAVESNRLHEPVSLKTKSRTAAYGFSVIMEPKGSLPCSQEPTAGFFPEPEESNSVFSSESKVSSLQLFWQKCCLHFSAPMHGTCCVHRNDIWRRVKLMKHLITQFSPVYIISSIVDSNILRSSLFSSTLILCSFLNRLYTVVLWDAL